MFLIIATVVLLLVLRHRGQLGPLVWEGAPALAPARGSAALTARPDDDEPERILARRLADGTIDSDEYLQNLSLLHSS